MMIGPPIRQWNNIQALAADPGPCGIILQKLEHGIRRAAASRDDTWEFLLGVKDLPADVQKFCRAAKSAEYGAMRLNRLAIGTATARTDWIDTLPMAKGSKADRLAEKIFRRWELAKPGFLETIVPSRMMDYFHAKSVAEAKGLARRMGSRKAEDLRSNHPSAENLWEFHPLETLMVTGWLRVPNSDPGLCFFSKTALSKFFDFLGWRESANSDPKEAMKDRLRRLGLFQGPILVETVRRDDNGSIILTMRTGKEHIFKTSVRTAGTYRYKAK